MLFNDITAMTRLAWRGILASLNMSIKSFIWKINLEYKWSNILFSRGLVMYFLFLFVQMLSSLMVQK